MTNNPTIDGVSREDERHSAVKALHDVMQEVPSASLYSLAEAVLDAGYAPAVERKAPKSAGDAFRALTKEDYERIGLAATVSQQATLISALQSTIAQLKAENDAIRSFANDLINGAFEGGSFDGGDIQGIAAKYGLMHIEQRTEACGESCACSEHGFPAECYRKNACLDATAALNGVKP